MTADGTPTPRTGDTITTALDLRAFAGTLADDGWALIQLPCGCPAVMGRGEDAPRGPAVEVRPVDLSHEDDPCDHDSQGWLSSRGVEFPVTVLFRPDAPQPATTDDAIKPEHGEVAAERARQVEKGYDEANDDRHGAYGLARMAQRYVLRGLDQGNRSDFIKAAGVLESAAASFRRLGHPLGTDPAALAAAGAGEACACEQKGEYWHAEDCRTGEAEPSPLCDCGEPKDGHSHRAGEAVDDGLTRVLVETRHPQDYTLRNAADGTSWRIEGGTWVRAEEAVDREALAVLLGSVETAVAEAIREQGESVRVETGSGESESVVTVDAERIAASVAEDVESEARAVLAAGAAALHGVWEQAAAIAHDALMEHANECAAAGVPKARVLAIRHAARVSRLALIEHGEVTP